MDAPNTSRESVLELAAQPSAYRTMTVIGLALLSAACGLTEPERPMMRLQGRVLSLEDRRPVSAHVQLQHEEGDGDWVLTSYTTVVDASTTSDASGWYDLEFLAVTCHSFDLRVEAEGFIPFTLERIACVDDVQTVNVELDPGTTRQASGRILIDASHDGGVWWFPQYGTYDPSVDHQGKRFADYVRSLGYDVDELGRDVVLTDSILDAYSMVIRAGEWGTYLPGELAAYARFLERETTLILLSDHRMTDPQDELAEMLGVTFTGLLTGSITRVAPHPVTGGLLGLRLIGGALASAFDPERVEILAWVENAPVMGTIKFGRARIIFLGDTNIVQSVPRPFVDHLVTWLVL